jgi:REP element-mobilizing transposase RayT
MQKALEPIYTANNCSAAFQLNWSVTLFGNTTLPTKQRWFESLRIAVEPDGVRILECHLVKENVVQFFVSTRPETCPSSIIGWVKGRLQYAIRDEVPAAFRRNYSIHSVGSAQSETLDRYVSGQNQKHRMADPRVQRCLELLQFHDPNIDLAAVRTGNYGQFIYALQIVLETVDGWNEIRERVLTASKNMVIGTARKKRWLLSRIGLLSNHIHILLGAHVTESPESIALSLLNNLAYAQKMVPAFRHSYYVGTFGPYDRQAIRRHVD